MKILLTGSGSGGHFYPLIAIAQQIRKISEEKKVLQPQIYYAGEESYDKDLLFRNDIEFKKITSGKIRRYFSAANFFDLFKTLKAVFQSLLWVFSIYPDVVFTNGGYGSFPLLFAARFFRIPVIVHISDTVPGKTAKWASKFAKKISVGFPDSIDYLPKEKVAYTGNPVRLGFDIPLKQGAHEFLKLTKETPTILILGGSQGAQKINDVVIDILPQLIDKYQIIHQTGKNNFKESKERANLILEKSSFKKRYKPFQFLDSLALRMAAGASDLVISRAGAGSISEISIWGLPSITIPITSSAGDHQRKNAFSYASTGATVVIEEKNLSANILLTEIDRIMQNKDIQRKMQQGSQSFARPEAAHTIADAILNIALKHEK